MDINEKMYRSIVALDYDGNWPDGEGIETCYTIFDPDQTPKEDPAPDYVGGILHVVNYILLGDIVEWPDAAADTSVILETAGDGSTGYAGWLNGIEFAINYLIDAGVINVSQAYYIVLGCMNLIDIKTCRTCVEQCYSPSE